MRTYIINYINTKGRYSQVEIPIEEYSDITERNWVEILNLIIKHKSFIRDVDIITEAFICEE